MKLFIMMSIFTIFPLSAFAQGFKKQFNNEVTSAFKANPIRNPEIITEADIAELPPMVKKYLEFSKVIGTEKVQNMKITFEGRIRSSEKSGWMKLKSVQYNFFDEPVRLFYIRATKAGIPATGLHTYRNPGARFAIKMLGLFTIQDIRDRKLDIAETITFFNDLCLLAPAALIDKRIQWQETGPLSAKATFVNGDITVSAILTFRENGELVNFVSHDRYEISDEKTFINRPFSTPVLEYTQYNNRVVVKKGQAVYTRPEGEFVYGEFILKEIRYNVKTR